MEATFEPQKTFPGDSPLQKSIEVINQVMTEVGTLANKRLNALIKLKIF
jgi:hypothetical protein